MTGESTAPVELEHTGAEEEPEVVEDFEPSAALLNWRTLVCDCKLDGPERSLAYTSELVSLDDTHAVLALASHALLNTEAKKRLADALSASTGKTFTVEIADQETQGAPKSIVRLEAQEKRAHHKELVAQFRSDAFVQKCAEFFDGSVDDKSVAEHHLVVEPEYVE